ncbi:SDR family NAD(P)-dependent oxidoreductase [Amycolatopsis sp., V23-08]|uniref:SDR family NAD(P)-dependent oxidoreductase n=1 Tax=Amycolatopsis heterodermiae TaxID=3110235 RepID=A0ABU5RH93_9PSEU|nr:SDR family NAD(P)-dependent oxidoreductase [Amycolatopsis sp., V23-08]MEA5364959.1 SDR family NAD(P)-dependent oxidoreductase [Amycolatopsis sp., V23-08]
MIAPLIDVVLDRTATGYTRFGYLLRRPHWRSGDPAPGSLKGKVALVTGAGSGLGQACAVELARLGASVVMLVRDLGRGEPARDDVLARVPGADVRLAQCDLSSLASVRACAPEFARVDVLIHNAGTLPPERTETEDGHEVTLATHVLGPLLLTELLRPALGDGRVIFMSSGGMYTQALAADDPEYRSGTYRGAVAYARTKRMQVELTPLLAQRWGLAVHSCHPGWADTPGLSSSLPAFRRLTRPFLRTAAQGADTAVWLAATEPPPPAGRFWHDRRPRPEHLLPRTRPSEAQVRELLAYCLEAVGETP